MTEKVFLNDRLVDVDKAAISVTDSGFLYGAGLFETMRACNGVVFCLNEHLDRLFSSAEQLSVELDYDRNYISDAIYALLEANNLSEARVRLTVTGGPMGETRQEHKCTLLVSATKFQPYPPEFYKNGVLVVLCPFRQNTTDPVFGHKTTSYFSRIMALDQARRKRAAEALWFTVDNRLAEGCITNVFLVKDSVLLTPPVNTPVLPGIARKTVCRLAKDNSIEVVEKDLYINDLLGADEVFLTNVVMQILPVKKVEQHVVGEGEAGQVTKKLLQIYEQYLKDQCGKGR